MLGEVTKRTNRAKQALFISLFVLLASAFLLGGSADAATGRAQNSPVTSFDLDARVACQTTVEEVLWQDRIWPAENPYPKPALVAVMPESAIRAKVKTTLRQSNALAALWQRPITGEMMQAEIERMAATTQQPARLHELWAALDNDPFLVAECLARPALAARLLEAWQPREDYSIWWQENAARFDSHVSLPAFTYELPPITGEAGDDESWLDTATIPVDTFGDLDGEAVWTGSEMLYLRDHSTQGFRYNPTIDTWETMTLTNTPQNRREFVAVWTGTKLVVWGGCSANNHHCTLSSGATYDPATDTWTDLPDAPLSRTRPSAVWTGSEMLIWGGCIYTNFDTCTTYPQTGLRFHPQTNSWQTMSTANAPAGREFPAMVWTGDEMIVWDGTEIPNSGGRFDPQTNTWQDISSLNAPAPQQNTLVWTGSEMIAWGGCTIPVDRCNEVHNEGGRYNPTTDTWGPLSLDDAPIARVDHRAIWTGEEMVIWGGCTAITGSLCTTSTATGGRYDPTSDSWEMTSISGAPIARHNHVALWTGEEMIVWGGEGDGSQRNGARYDPDTNSWVPVSEEDPQSFRHAHEAVWTGAEMIVWGGLGDGDNNGGLNSGRRYDPVLDQWSSTTLASAPQGRRAHTLIWTGAEMVVWGGADGTTLLDSGGRYNPMTDSWSGTPSVGAPTERADHTAVWTGTEMIIWGGAGNFATLFNNGGRYDPSTNSWMPLSVTNAPAGREDHTAIWTGDEMTVWGGYGAANPLDSGGRYDPVADTWAPTSASGAPEARFLHTTVWTGDEMIVWGGRSDYTTELDTGGRYDPVADNWTPTSLSGAPSPRVFHTAVWTGSEMIVWGTDCLSICLPDGGQYAPDNDTWQPTSLENAPEARQQHTAVWTGDEMIVWGGIGVENGILNTGGRYILATTPPASDQLHLPYVVR